MKADQCNLAHEAASSEKPGFLLKIQIFIPHLRSTEAESVGVGPGHPHF